MRLGNILLLSAKIKIRKDTNHSWPTWVLMSWSHSQFQCEFPCTPLCQRSAAPVTFLFYYNVYGIPDVMMARGKLFWKWNPLLFVTTHTHLTRLEEVKANVGVTGGRINTVLTEVLTDVFRCGLRQKSVYAFPKAQRIRFKYIPLYKAGTD